MSRRRLHLHLQLGIDVQSELLEIDGLAHWLAGSALHEARAPLLVDCLDLQRGEAKAQSERCAAVGAVLVADVDIGHGELSGRVGWWA